MSRIAAIRGVMSRLAGGAAEGALTAGGVAAGGLFAGEVLGPPVVDAVEGLLQGGRREEAMIGAVRSQRDLAWAERIKAERIQQDMAASAERLARTNPTLYASILARRPLPEEAVWIGGTPGQDLLDEVARGMAEGRFEMPPTATQQYQG